MSQNESDLEGLMLMELVSIQVIIIKLPLTYFV